MNKKAMLLCTLLMISTSAFAKWDMDGVVSVIGNLMNVDFKRITDGKSDDIFELNDPARLQYSGMCIKNVITINGNEIKLSGAMKSNDGGIRKYFGGGVARAQACMMVATHLYNKIVSYNLTDASDDFDNVRKLNSDLKKFIDSAPAKINTGSSTGQAWKDVREIALAKYNEVAKVLNEASNSTANKKTTRIMEDKTADNKRAVWGYCGNGNMFSISKYKDEDWNHSSPVIRLTGGGKSMNEAIEIACGSR